ncbi:hypothetical protein ETB97_010504 [Aspergillus alliaceus]|uniref:Uncharacterized protein n=1 Tax=Petromyces alliaceus TaxID=209559 RepID=A0A8H6E888_PETAA|nr:hypothetical protein ETB97_010504 [Aspergillus burnettii]
MFGKLYHLFSIKHVFLASVAIFEIGSLIAGAAPTSAALVLGRAVSGVVRGTSATASGALSLPIAIGVPLAVFCGSSATSLLGYYTPFMIVTGILTLIAAGLLTTLSVKQSLTSFLCYKALLGIGAGVGFRGPQVAVQTVLSVKDSPIGIAIIIFAQNFGPALFVSIAQTVFTGQPLARVGSILPNLDAYPLSAMGMTDLEKYGPPADMDRVIEGYDKALTTAFFLPVGLACVSMIGAWGWGGGV